MIRSDKLSDSRLRVSKTINSCSSYAKDNLHSGLDPEQPFRGSSYRLKAFHCLLGLMLCSDSLI